VILREHAEDRHDDREQRRGAFRVQQHHGAEREAWQPSGRTFDKRDHQRGDERQDGREREPRGSWCGVLMPAWADRRQR
jgi:hypothetical protein